MCAVLFAPGAATNAAARTAKEIRQCKALNKCRDEFTRCYYRIERDPKKSWEKNEWECAKPYKDCIGRNFGTFDMLFTRLFDPRVLDCSK
jgi:hypothetical protein